MNFTIPDILIKLVTNYDKIDEIFSNISETLSVQCLLPSLQIFLSKNDTHTSILNSPTLPYLSVLRQSRKIPKIKSSSPTKSHNSSKNLLDNPNETTISKSRSRTRTTRRSESLRGTLAAQRSQGLIMARRPRNRPPPRRNISSGSDRRKSRKVGPFAATLLVVDSGKYAL